MTIATCKLCLAENVPLRDSHIIPRWAYKRIHSYDPAIGNRHPVKIQHGVAMTSGEQETEYLLCGDCEQRLGVFDAYVSGVTSTVMGQLPLLSKLGTVTPIAHFAVAQIDPVDAVQLCRFASSVFFRAHVASKIAVNLGPYGEEMRRYLRDEGPFPRHARLSLHVLKDAPAVSLDLLITLPKTFRRTAYHCHQFVLFGLLFYLAVGKSRQMPSHALCLHHGDPKLLTLVRSLDLDFIKNTVRMASEARVVGALARRK